MWIWQYNYETYLKVGRVNDPLFPDLDRFDF